MGFKKKIYTVLKRVEKYTKTDMVYLTTGTFWLGINQIVTAVFSFILAVALANLLPENVFGNYRYILSLSVIVGSFSLTGLNLAIARDVARGVGGLLRIGFTYQLKWSIGTLIASLGIGAYFFIKGNSELALAGVIMGIFTPLISSTHLYTAFWEGKHDFRRISIYSMFTIVIYASSLFAAVHFTHYLPLIVLTYFASQAFCSILFFTRSLKFDTEPEKSAHETVTLSKHFSFLNILSTVAAQLDKVLVFHYLGAPQLAIYAISQIPVTQIRGPFKQVTQLAYSKFAKRTLSDIHSGIFRKMVVLTIPAALIVILYIILAPFIFKTFFPKYLDAVLFSQVSMLSLLFFQKKLIALAILAKGSKKHIYSMSIWASVFKITLLLILLPHYGIWGAIFTEIIGHILGLGSSIYMLNNAVKKERG